MSWLKKFDLKTLAILVLIIIVVLRGCGDDSGKPLPIVKVDGKDYELLKQKIDTVFVDKIVEVPKYVPKYIDRVVEKIVEIPADVDSLKIIEDYYSKYVVKDTLKLTYEFAPEIVIDAMGTKPNPTLGFGILTDTISQNQIVSRDVIWNFQVPTIYNTKVVKELPKTQLYWGLNGGFNREDVITNISGSLLLKTKKDKIFQLGLGVQNNSNTQQLSPYISAGMYWKISLGKKK